MKNESTPAPHESAQLSLASEGAQLSVPPMSMPSPLGILEAAMKGGVTSENISVVKELIQLCREQRAEDAKAAFARAFFQLKKNMPVIYADKEAKDRSGNVVYTYSSEEELSKALEPHLTAYGFAMLFGQQSVDGRITAKVTIMHEGGHSEEREFTVRAGAPNAMKDGAMCDVGGATTAWRHLMIKMFGLKSRIHAENDATVLGARISPEKALYLKELVRETKSDEVRFLKWCQVTRYEDIGENDYPRFLAEIQKKMK